MPLCRKYGWALLLPEFRGPNLDSNPQHRQACGSELAIQDIFDAIDMVKNNHKIDATKIFLLGCSGGGHMALLAAAKKPTLFRAVEVWCPVTNLVAWQSFSQENNLEYHHHLAACMGTDYAEYRRRSPIDLSDQLKTVNLSLHHGKHDTVVSWHDSWRFAEKLQGCQPENFYFDFFDGEHEQIPEQSFTHFANIVGVERNRTEITG